MENKNRIKIFNQTFNTKSDLDPYIECWGFSLKNFVNCKFEKINLLGRVFNVSDFKDCIFNDFVFRKCEFANCTFEGCRIVESDLTRAEFTSCSFRNCEFIQSDLAGATFLECEFIETTSKNSNLDPIVVLDVKVWESDKWVEINDSSSFKKFLIDLNSD